MFNVQLLPQVLYIAAHATWPLKFYRELDRILAHAIWRMYHLPPSYPTDLIFLPKTDCGLNFKRISDLAQIQKWGMLGRTSALGPASTSITHSLIKRAIETPSSTVLFATSLVEWGLLNNMSLGVRSITPEVCVELIDQLKLNAHDIESLPIGGIFSDGAFTPAPVSPSALLTHPSRLLQIFVEYHLCEPPTICAKSYMAYNAFRLYYRIKLQNGVLLAANALLFS
jgi:hypothetical protein